MNEIHNDTEEIIATKQAIDKNAIETESRAVGWTAIFAPIVFFPFGIYFSIIPIIIITRAFHYVKKKRVSIWKVKELSTCFSRSVYFYFNNSLSTIYTI